MLTPISWVSGCARCKRRRQKCDEVRPYCGRCHKAGIVCRYSVQLKWGGRIFDRSRFGACLKDLKKIGQYPLSSLPFSGRIVHYNNRSKSLNDLRTGLFDSTSTNGSSNAYPICSKSLNDLDFSVPILSLPLQTLWSLLAFVVELTHWSRKRHRWICLCHFQAASPYHYRRAWAASSGASIASIALDHREIIALSLRT